MITMGTFNANNWKDMVIKPTILESDKVTQLNQAKWKDFQEEPEELGDGCIVYAIIFDKRVIWVVNYQDNGALHQERLSSQELERVYRFSKQESVMNTLVTELV